MSIAIGYPDIPFKSVLTASEPESGAFSALASIAAGQRHCYSFGGDSGARAFLMDLGSNYAAKGGIADYLAIARADIGDQTNPISSVQVYYSDNGSSYTLVSAPSVTLMGNRLEDFVTTFTSTTAHRYWMIVVITGGVSDVVISKLFLGQLLQFPEAPWVEFERIPARSATWTASSGAKWLAHTDAPIARITCRWEAVTDALIKSFEDNVSAIKHISPVFLITTANHDLLENARVIHCQLTGARAKRDGDIANRWTLEADFLEVLG